MPYPKLLDIHKSALIVIDVQEAFRNSIGDFSEIASRISMAVRGFQLLDVPVMVTEQYPKGLSHTAEKIQLVLPDDFQAYEKTAFSSCGAASFVAKLDEIGVKQTVLCGMETHVCVNQTAHDLLDKGFDVHLLTDCVGSRFAPDKNAGLEKMRSSGVAASTVEMALFELMRDAKHEKFKEIQALIK